MPRSEGITTPFCLLCRISVLVCPRKCPDQRGLRLLSVLPRLHNGTVRGNAPIRGDYDFLPTSVRWRPEWVRGNAPIRGDYDMASAIAAAILRDVSEEMPRSEGITTLILILCSSACQQSPRKCPDQRGLRPEYMMTKTIALSILSEEMPRSEGITTWIVALDDGTEVCVRGNAPIRGDYDASCGLLLLPSVTVRGNAPIRGDYDKSAYSSLAPTL